MLNNLKNKTMIDSATIYSQSRTFAEKNDCTVRASTMAFQCKYAVAHDLMKTRLDRKHGNGTRMTATKFQQMADEKLIVNGKIIRMVGVNPNSSEHFLLPNSPLLKKRTVRSFIKQNPKGNFFILIKRHAIGVCDGKISDWGEADNSRIRCVFEMIDAPVNVDLNNVKLEISRLRREIRIEKTQTLVDQLNAARRLRRKLIK